MPGWKLWRVRRDQSGAAKSTRGFEIYIHDPSELVAISTYKIANIAKLSVFKDDIKKKVQIYPSYYVKKGYSETVCNGANDYSREQCNTIGGWNKRIRQMRDMFGPRMACVLPGVMNTLGYEMCRRKGHQRPEDLQLFANETKSM